MVTCGSRQTRLPVLGPVPAGVEATEAGDAESGGKVVIGDKASLPSPEEVEEHQRQVVDVEVSSAATLAISKFASFVRK